MTEMSYSSTSVLTSSPEKAKRSFTWEEVAAHCTAKSVWIVYDDKVYDVTTFLPRHPGGKELLLLGAGRDCTQLIDMYHPFTKKPHAILRKFEIGRLTSWEHPHYKKDSGFYKDICQAAKDYFQHSGLDPKNPSSGLWRLGIFLLSLALFFVLSSTSILGDFSLTSRIIFGVFYGIFMSLMMLHTMHDSSHGALGQSEWMWQLGRIAFDFLNGGCMSSWHNQHVIGHHIYTNVFECDPDLPVVETGDPRRLVHRQRQNPLYKWQWLYLPPLYGTLTMKNRLQDFVNFYNESNGPIRVNPYNIMHWAQMLGSKAVWFGWRIMMPLYLFHESGLNVLLPFLAGELTTSYYLAFIFQVSHVSNACSYYNDQVRRSVIDDEWAVSQVRSSVDYGYDSALCTFFAGALNYQTIHHLLPGISQYHYPALAPLVRNVCAKHGVKFNYLPGFREAWLGHFHHLVTMGKEGQQVHLHMG